MEQNDMNALLTDCGINDSLIRIQQYLEINFNNLTKQLIVRDDEIRILRAELEKVQNQMEGNRQLINKLLGDLSKLQNDIDWYKRTYEQRSFLGTIREKVFRK